MIYGRLNRLPFFIYDKLVTSFLPILRQDGDRSSLPLISRVDVTHRRHNRSVSHQLFDLYNVNARTR
jgi:hypothetical protein